MAVTEKQLKNLKPAKKGEIRNPEGGRAHNPITKALKKITIESYREIIETILKGNLEELRAIAADPKTPALQVGIAVAFMNAIKKGDYQVIERIAERIVGKIPDELNVIANTNTNVTINTLDKDKLKAALDKFREDI